MHSRRHDLDELEETVGVEVHEEQRWRPLQAGEVERWWGWGGDGQGGAEVGVGRAGDDVGLQRRGVGGWWRKGGSLCAPERAWTASRMPAVCCSVLRFCNGQCAGQELTQKMIKDGPES